MPLMCSSQQSSVSRHSTTTTTSSGNSSSTVTTTGGSRGTANNSGLAASKYLSLKSNTNYASSSLLPKQNTNNVTKAPSPVPTYAESSGGVQEVVGGTSSSSSSVTAEYTPTLMKSSINNSATTMFTSGCVGQANASNNNNSNNNNTNNNSATAMYRIINSSSGVNLMGSNSSSNMMSDRNVRASVPLQSQTTRGGCLAPLNLSNSSGKALHYPPSHKSKRSGSVVSLLPLREGLACVTTAANAASVVSSRVGAGAGVTHTHYQHQSSHQYHGHHQQQHHPGGRVAKNGHHLAVAARDAKRRKSSSFSIIDYCNIINMNTNYQMMANFYDDTEESMARLSLKTTRNANIQKQASLSEQMAALFGSSMCTCYLCRMKTVDAKKCQQHNFEITPNKHNTDYSIMKYTYSTPFSQLSALKLFNLMNTDCSIVFAEQQQQQHQATVANSNGAASAQSSSLSSVANDVNSTSGGVGSLTTLGVNSANSGVTAASGLGLNVTAAAATASNNNVNSSAVLPPISMMPGSSSMQTASGPAASPAGLAASGAGNGQSNASSLVTNGAPSATAAAASVTLTMQQFMHANANSPPIYDARYLYLIDCRPNRKRFEKARIHTAIHYTDLLSDAVYLSPPVDNYTLIVLYDDDGTFLTSSSPPPPPPSTYVSSGNASQASTTFSFYSSSNSNMTTASAAGTTAPGACGTTSNAAATIETSTTNVDNNNNNSNNNNLEMLPTSSDEIIARIRAKINCQSSKTIHLLSGGYEQFHSKFPFMCTQLDVRSTADRHKYITVYPNCVIENQIYIGSGIQAKNWKIIRDLRVTHIINCSIEHECVFKDEIKYLHFKIEDNYTENIYKVLNTALEFVKEAFDKYYEQLIRFESGSDCPAAASLMSALTAPSSSSSSSNSSSSGVSSASQSLASTPSQGASRSSDANAAATVAASSSSNTTSARPQPPVILIHCNLGISRSSSILIAYLISKYKMCLYAAFKYVKDKRLQIAPNYSFLRQLKQYEEHYY